MDLVCFEVETGRVEIRPGTAGREWMDETPERYAYRCLPLTAANGHGWELLCPLGFEAVWGGGADPGDLVLTFDDGPPPPPSKWSGLLDGVPGASASLGSFVESHFGNGILTFNPLLIVRTPPAYDLWLSGPANRFKDGAAPMTALVETDWIPFTFSMSWKLTRPGLAVRFEAGEPFCAFFPVPRGLVGRFEPKLRPLARDPELARDYWAARAERSVAVAAASGPDRYQSWYARRRAARREGHGDGPSPGAARPFVRED